MNVWFIFVGRIRCDISFHWNQWKFFRKNWTCCFPICFPFAKIVFLRFFCVICHIRERARKLETNRRKLKTNLLGGDNQTKQNKTNQNKNILTKKSRKRHGQGFILFRLQFFDQKKFWNWKPLRFLNIEINNYKIFFKLANCQKSFLE